MITFPNRKGAKARWHKCKDGKCKVGVHDHCQTCLDPLTKWTWEVAGEEWRPVPSVPGYLASNFGRVKHCSPARPPRPGYLAKRGYLAIRAKVDYGRDRGNLYVHAMVAEAFLGPRPPGLVINHIDGNTRNNRPENLEYVTQKQNVAHAAAMGRHNANRKGVPHRKNRKADDAVKLPDTTEGR